MKKFDIKYIREYIENHRKEISCVLCGCAEAWFGSSCVVFCNGNYKIDLFKLNSSNNDEIVRCPYMQVIFNDGCISYLMCHEEVFD